MRTVAAMRASWDGYRQAAALRAAVAADTAARLPAAVAAAAKAFDSTLAAVGGNPEGGRGFFGGGGRPPPTFVRVNADLVGQINNLENGDMTPTEAVQRDYAAGGSDVKKAGTAWRVSHGA